MSSMGTQHKRGVIPENGREEMRITIFKAGLAGLVMIGGLAVTTSAAAFWGGPPGFGGPGMRGFAPGYGGPDTYGMPRFAPRPWGSRGYGWRPPQYAPSWRRPSAYRQSATPKQALPGLCR